MSQAKWKPIKGELPKKPGVYALVSGPAILYIGSTKNLNGRLRRQKKDGSHWHHLLWYTHKTRNLQTEKLQESLNRIYGKFPTKVLFYEHGNPEDTVEYNWDGGKKTVPTWKAIEQSLLIQHFLKFDQFPRFNSSSPSIKSINDYWDWWEAQLNQFEPIWNGLLEPR